MKNNMFSGWKEVFLFTFKQGCTNKYKAFTFVLSLILLISGIGLNIIIASSQMTEDDVSPIEKVYVIDESNLESINWTDSKQLDRGKFPKVTFEVTDVTVEELGRQLKASQTLNVIAKITKSTDEFKLYVYLPDGSEVEKKEAEKLGKVMAKIVQDGLISESKIDGDKLSYIVSSIDTEFSVVGETAKNDVQRLVTTIFPMLFMLVLYFMVLIYGQNMGYIVSVEKSSKLMETLLICTRPYGLIFGKILATSLIAIIQMAAWIVATVVGFIAGDRLARSIIYSDYDNVVLSLFQEVSKDELTNAFTTEAIILTVIAICFGFLFYCMLAGAVASFASKADELGSVMMFYNMFLIFGFFGSYALPSMVGQEWIKVVVHLIPVAAAFLLPGEIMVGTISIGAGIVYLLVLAAWIVAVAIFAGKVYKDQLFYRGKSLKERLPWLKGSKEEDSDEPCTYLHDEAGRPIEKSLKVGYFFVAISPLAIFLVIQVLASFVLTNVLTRIGLRGIDLDKWEVKDFVDFYHGIEPTLNPMTVMVSHLLIITTFGVWMYFIRRGIDRIHILPVKSLKDKKLATIIGLCVVCGLCLCIFANGVVAIEAATIPSVVEDYIKMANNSGFGKSPFAIFAAVCLAPIGEELLCRGVCLHFGKKSFGKFWYANILQAVLFGVLHMNWVQGVYAFFIGLVLGILVERYESLLPAMFVHFIVNFSSSTWVPKVLGNVEVSLGMGIFMVAIPGIITMAALYLSRTGMRE